MAKHDFLTFYNFYENWDFSVFDSFQNTDFAIQLNRRSRLVYVRSSILYKILMARWDYDTMFYRVFCTALLVVALTFTVILTNVFIDIDGLLYKKSKDNIYKLEAVQADANDRTPNIPERDVYDYQDYDSYVAERTKRSLETQDFSFHIQDPKMKKVISNRLAALLEDLDKNLDKSSKTNHKEHREANTKLIDYKKSLGRSGKYTEIVKNSHSNEVKTDNRKGYKNDVEILESHIKSVEDIDKIELLDDIERLKKEKDKKQSNHTEQELKHLAMHNIILQGIIGHMDLGEVYARVHALIHNLETPEVNKDNLKGVLHPTQNKQLYNELINCKLLKDEIVAEATKQEITITPQTEKEIKKPTVKPSGRNVMIKTIIDITSLANDKTDQDVASSVENVNGIIKLIYNGKSLKFRRVDEGTTAKSKVLKQVNEKLSADLRVESNIESIKDAEDKILNTDKSRDPNTYVPNTYMNRMISEYLKRFSKEADSLENTKKFTTKRLKRHIKIRYENEEASNITTEAPKPDGKKGDDELYVEIETHFDSKGLKGEKKKKMIRDLIQKIQKAIHSEKEVKKKKHKHLHVKKRTQNPLDSNNAATFIDKMLKPLDNLVHRESDPISKSAPLHEKLPYFADDKGDDWRTSYHGPRFLTVSKAINSAEMSEVDTDYNKIMDNGIPERLQKPLNTDTNDGTFNFNNAQDPGNSKFIVKNIAGSGFSIGFNQYIDEPPDAESMKLFTGIENIIQTYHQKYDEEGTNANAENTNQDNPFNPEYQPNQEEPTNSAYPAPETDDHLIIRRSIKKVKDYHSNEYKVIFNKNFLNYDNYQDVYNGKGHYSTAKNTETKKNANPSLVIDDNIFSKDLKPAEIFSLADILERQKRSLNVKKISNIKNKKKINRYLNTKSMASKKIFQQNKRSKRQIDKIRIIAKDHSRNHKHNSEEDIFVLSDEKIFADRAMVKEVETDMEPNEKFNEEHFDVITPQKPSEEHFDIITPQKVSENHYDIISPQKVTENHYEIISPYIFEAPSMETNNANNVFTRRSRHNSLMSKYPHIFMEEISRSKENYMPDSSLMYGKMIDQLPINIGMTTQVAPPLVEIPEPQYIPEPNFKTNDIQEIVDQSTINDYPPQEKGNYKVTVKIMPKNNTGLNSGFKEIHTSINKSYNKNGLVYTSLVNVSEISKVEKINKTKENNDFAHPSVHKLKREQLKMKSMIQQHKNRIEEQLAHLNREKEKLERIDIKNAKFFKDVPQDYVDVALPTNPARTLHITKEDLGRLFTFEETTTTEQPTTKPLTTTVYIEPITEDPEKIKIINTIERNENITNEILRKIDKNTNILQTFLNRLISKLEAPIITTQKPKEYHKKSKNDDKDDNYDKGQPKNTNTEVTKTNEIYDHNIPGMLFSEMPREAYRNGSAGIPFVYAFQQPYTIPNSDNKDVPIASVVYQGHIHAHTINNKPGHAIRKSKEKANAKMELKANNTKPLANNNNYKPNNSSKFFIDDLENDYKVLPVLGKTVFPDNSGNGTKM